MFIDCKDEVFSTDTIIRVGAIEICDRSYSFIVVLDRRVCVNNIRRFYFDTKESALLNFAEFVSKLARLK